MELRIKEGTISKNKDSVFGVVYFQENDFYFPDENWNDFIVILFEWWSSSIFKLLNNESISEDLSFMDGPFMVRVKYIEEDFFELFFVDQDDIILETYKVNIKEFVTSFLQKTNYLIRQLHSMKITNEDVKQLEKNYQKIQKIFIGPSQAPQSLLT